MVDEVVELANLVMPFNRCMLLCYFLAPNNVLGNGGNRRSLLVFEFFSPLHLLFLLWGFIKSPCFHAWDEGDFFIFVAQGGRGRGGIKVYYSFSIFFSHIVII
jgi:hypothetical protein